VLALGACFLGAEVIDRALARGNFKVDDMLAILKSGTDWIDERRSVQGLSGRSGAVKIRDMVAASSRTRVDLSQVRDAEDCGRLLTLGSRRLPTRANRSLDLARALSASMARSRGGRGAE
jgi:hypothetical protein